MIETLTYAVEKVGNVYEQQSENFRELVSCFKHEKEATEKRKKLMALLKEVDGLTYEQRMKAVIIIAKDNSLTDVIFELGSEDTLGFVLEVLNLSA